jgi:hypothetical protein
LLFHSSIIAPFRSARLSGKPLTLPPGYQGRIGGLPDGVADLAAARWRHGHDN